MVEFALVAGLFFLVVGGVVQFGLLVWSQNTVTQIARDTARWAVTQSTTPCGTAAGRNALAVTADRIARDSRLIAYAPGTWSSAPSIASLGAEGVGADWPIPSPPPALFPSDCPPADSATAWFVRVRVNHVVPIVMPGIQFIAPPCGGSGFCLSSTTELRMEPKRP